MFRLALEFGCTVADLEDRLSESELHEWAAFYRLEPFGASAAWLRHGHLCAVIVNAISNAARAIAGGKRSAGAGARPDDFLPAGLRARASISASDRVRLGLRAAFGDRVKLPKRLEGVELDAGSD